MPSSEPGLPEIYLRPGELFVAHEPTIIRTILGSCVGITFWSEERGVGALCHAMLPRAPKPTAITSSLTSAHGYVDFCIFDLARQFDALGVTRSKIQVKLFGGADVLAVENPAAKPTVGRLNCETAVEVLREEGYGVTASSLGGNAGLKISFNTGSGEVLLLRLT